MTATKADIDRWLSEGKRKGARWVIIGLDNFDYGNYPIYVMPDDNFYQRYGEVGSNGGGGMGDTVDEVYDLTRAETWDDTKRGRRWHMPPRDSE